MVWTSSTSRTRSGGGAAGADGEPPRVAALRPARRRPGGRRRRGAGSARCRELQPARERDRQRLRGVEAAAAAPPRVGGHAHHRVDAAQRRRAGSRPSARPSCRPAGARRGTSAPARAARDAVVGERRPRRRERGARGRAARPAVARQGAARAAAPRSHGSARRHAGHTARSAAGQRRPARRAHRRREQGQQLRERPGSCRRTIARPGRTLHHPIVTIAAVIVPSPSHALAAAHRAAVVPVDGSCPPRPRRRAGRRGWTSRRRCCSRSRATRSCTRCGGGGRASRAARGRRAAGGSPCGWSGSRGCWWRSCPRSTGSASSSRPRTWSSTCCSPTSSRSRSRWR